MVFPDDNGILQKGINQRKFDSSDDQVKMFVRELCQNSSDASADGGKVTIDFQYFIMDTHEFPDREGFLQTLKDCQSTLWGHKRGSSDSCVFANMIETLQGPTIPVMRASDYGTTGARGSNVSKRGTSSPWGDMTISRGISNKDGKSGGSFGNGKDSFFAVSDLYTIFFSTNDIDGLQASFGSNYHLYRQGSLYCITIPVPDRTVRTLSHDGIPGNPAGVRISSSLRPSLSWNRRPR